ncbi:TPA: hypothetical protein N0F65_000496 [Lagenidium giganteum]|uniref:Uncharacterized protein n=1 Tax=Lagenidium giganteum TaxID=4803 RepID=A0AAV2YZU0_9STRA|nr:TPA: hypothetical protein N0F65_000496 [Lagenidium giganteum]
MWRQSTRWRGSAYAAKETSNDTSIPFLWVNCALSLVSYALLLSDELRTGLGTRDLVYRRVAPNYYVYFGPFNYSVVHVAHNDSASTKPVWSYKFDSTSIGLRAFAKYMQVSVWPRCVFYDFECSVSTLGFPLIFAMLDQLIDTFASQSSSSAMQSRVPFISSMVLRTKNRWIERSHQLLLVPFFSLPVSRSNQMLHYPSAILDDASFQICRVRPALFRGLMTTFTVELRHWDGNIQTTDLISIVESNEDRSNGGVSFRGRGPFDVTTIMRVQECYRYGGSTNRSLPCTTLLLDEYRYEGTLATSDVVDWCLIVTILRGSAQLYVWLRIAMLALGCYAASSSLELVQTRVWRTFVTMFKVPGQTIVYGSIFPIAVYAVAHYIDSAMTYEITAQKFATPLGVFDLDKADFLRNWSLQMRNVWLLALVLHVLAFNTTQVVRWTIHSIVGVPEFAIAFGRFRAITVSVVPRLASRQYRQNPYLSTRADTEETTRQAC